MANVYDVADFFIDIINKRDDDQITNLKLNKLLFFAQGVYLARTGKPLFLEDIQAWSYGPVVPCIYQKYKVYSKSPIVQPDKKVPDFAEDVLETLLDVLREFGKYTGEELINMTHVPGSPWAKAYELGANTTISDESMKEYFSTSRVVERFRPVRDIPVVQKLPREWYDPNDDELWESSHK